MNKTSGIILSLVLGLSIISPVLGANDLNKVDIKRSTSSSSALNVTIYTANPYDENVAVTQKADNKYVILMPNISGVNASNIDYSGIQDIVSDVSLRSVDDSANGYTKITLTTTKPVSITTTTKKSTPLTEEQKAYKNLIAQSRGYSQTKPTTNKGVKQEISTVTVPGVNSTVAKQTDKAKTQDKTANNVSKPNTNTKTTSEEVKNVLTNVAIADKNKANTKAFGEKIALNKTQLNENVNKNQVQQNINSKNAAVNNIREIPEEQLNNGSFSTNDLKNEKEAKASMIENKILNNNEKEISKSNVDTGVITVSQSVNQLPRNDKGTEKNMLTTIIILLSSILGLTALFKGIKNSIEGSVALKKSFKYNLHERPHEPITDYSDIASDDSLSWQEKYKKFVNAAVEISPTSGLIRDMGDGEYEVTNPSAIEAIYGNKPDVNLSDYFNSFAQAAKLKFSPKLKSYNRPARNSSPDAVPPIKKVKNQTLKNESAPTLKLVEEKPKYKNYKDLTDSLERTLHNSPSVERINIDEASVMKQMENINNISNGSINVYKEEDAIANTVQKLPKLKSFANKIALEETKRNMPLPKHRSEVIKSRNIESPYVNLENSGLYSTPRSFANGNLSSADLINKNKIMTNRNVTSPIQKAKYKQTGYSTITIDDFFDALDSSSKYTAPATLASKVADNLGRMHSEDNNTSAAQQSNHNDVFGGKVIKAGYNIDSNSGFYIISDGNGKDSLVGKINNKITVLKEFSSSTDSKLQVRKDSENVYLVRAAGERYLVEVDENKMGILLEL